MVLHTTYSWLCRFGTPAKVLVVGTDRISGEAAGYYGRAMSHSNIRNGGPYLLQLMLILASAPLIAATVYMTLGRLIYALNAREHAIMSPRWTTKIYVLIDIVSFCAQLAGSAMQSSGDAAGVKQGNTIVIAGLGIQLGALVFFILNASVFHRRLNQEPTTTATGTHVRWRRHLWALYSVCTLILVRSVFRLTEFIEGPEAAIYKKEAYLYVFDSTLMFLTVLIMAVVHPGMLLRAVRKAEIQRLSCDGSNGEFLLESGGKR